VIRDTAMIETWRYAIANDPGDCWPVAADWLQEQGLEGPAAELRAVADRTQAVRWWDTRVGRYSMATNPEMAEAVRWFWRMDPQWVATCVSNIGRGNDERYWQPFRGWVTLSPERYSPHLGAYVASDPQSLRLVDLTQYGIGRIVESRWNPAGELFFDVRFRVWFSPNQTQAYVRRPVLDDIRISERKQAWNVMGNRVEPVLPEPWHWSDFPREVFGPHFRVPTGETQ
jgi:hypothetical protein